jgi:hypothetical protein
LELQHVVLSGCRQQGIVLRGPRAALTATSVVFERHASASKYRPGARLGLPKLGLVLAATQARVELANVTIRRNSGERYVRGPGVRGAASWRPYAHPPCQDASVAGGMAPGPVPEGVLEAAEHAAHARQQACGSPLLASSLIDLDSSSLVVRGGALHDNAADALISARGAAPDALQLVAGTRVRNNTVRWLLVADSWVHDPVGRANMKAPQPSEVMPGVHMQAPYTNFELMGHLRGPPPSAAAAGEAAAAAAADGGGGGGAASSAGSVLSADAAAPPADAAAPDGAVGRRRRLQQQPRQQQGERPQPRGQQPLQQLQQQQGVEQPAADDDDEERLLQPRQQLTSDSEQQQQQQQQDAASGAGAYKSPDDIVGRAPGGQVPLQVRLAGVSIRHNTVQSGLVWLRLVNATLSDVDIAYNIGIGNKWTALQQLRAAAEAAAAAAARNATAAAAAVPGDAFEALSRSTVDRFALPPGPCDTGALQRALLIAHAPSALTIDRYARARVCRCVFVRGDGVEGGRSWLG